MTRRTHLTRAAVLAAVLAAFAVSACSRSGSEPPPALAIATAADLDLKETTVRNVTDRTRSPTGSIRAGEARGRRDP